MSKKINKTRKFTISGSIPSGVVKQADGTPSTYDIRDTLIVILRQPLSPNGTNYEEMEKALRVLRKVKEPEDETTLENDEYDYLCQALKNHRFPHNDPGVHDWISSILALKELPN